MGLKSPKAVFTVVFPRVDITNYQKLGGLTQWEAILSQFWRLEVWSQGANTVTLPKDSLTVLPCLSHSVAFGSL